MNKRPNVKISAYTANCVEIIIDGVRIIACKTDNGISRVAVYADGNAGVEVFQ